MTVLLLLAVLFVLLNLRQGTRRDRDVAVCASPVAPQQHVDDDGLLQTGAMSMKPQTGSTAAGKKEAAQPTSSPASATDTYEKVYMSESTGKYGPVRIAERWQRAAGNAGNDQMVLRTMMAGGHVMVQLREGRSQADLKKTLRQHGFKLRSGLPIPRGFLVAVEEPDVGSVPALIKQLKAAPAVGLVEPDYVYTIAETRPDDDQYGPLWGMEKIDMPRVWDSTSGTGGVVVAIFDTGIDLNHLDLSANIWMNPDEIDGNGIDDDGNAYTDDIHGWDFYDNDSDPTDAQQHGSHVAGTIGAVGNNGVGVAGVGWNIRLLPIKFFGYNSSGRLEGYTSDAVSGMYYVMALADRGVPIRVTNHSWGGTGESALLEDVFRVAAQFGILHVAAAGNGTGAERNNDLYPHYPASYALSNIVAVANTTSSDGLSSGSCYGAISVDLGAPGEGILSTIPGSGYGYKTGTSMATPHVAGALGLLFDMFPAMAWQDARTVLFDSVEPLGALNGYCTTGGRLNTYQLLAQVPTEIQHEPLPNSDVENTSFPVEIRLKPGVSFVDTNTVQMLWNTTGSTNVFTTNRMAYVGDNRFESELPGKPRGTTLYYMIRVETADHGVTTHPVDAPASLHQFDVTFPVSLSVYGHPGEYGLVSPAYGPGNAAWGTTVEAVAPAFTAGGEGQRWRCTGWDGAGSVPLSGTTNRVTFQISKESHLLWWWQEQVALTQVSDPVGVIDAVSWIDVGTSAATLAAPGTAMIGDLAYAFIGWEIEGLRFPDSVSPALNPAAPLTVLAPQTATAQYMLASLDSDGDGLPDWWELFYYNHLDTDGTADTDLDGATNADEHADRSNPRDSESLPQGPTIQHDPLPDAIAEPSPWEVTAVITDRVDVAVAVLYWQRNEGRWNELRMTAEGANYAAAIPSPDAPGDRFSYRIEAVDTAGYTNTTAIFSFTVRYPVLGYTPGSATVAADLGSSALVWVTLTNAGNADLTWQTENTLAEYVADTNASWTHAGAADQWHVSAQMAYSGPYAWFCGAEGGGAYNNSMDASLYTPTVLLGGNAQLQFMQWAEMEYDGRVGYENHFWDGAVVELSRDDGATFDAIEPVGGYPYMITPNDESPFAYNRPCLGGITGGWEAVQFDLSAYAGEQVQIRFRFGSDGYVASRGWFLDDIVLSWNDPWLVAPASGSVAAGASETVELRVETDMLSYGTVTGAWTVVCNAPGNARFGVSIVFDVRAQTSIQLDSQDPGQFVLRWATQTGHTYHLSSSTGFARWIGVPGYTNLPGLGDVMSYTGSVESLPRKFYRILETAE